MEAARSSGKSLWAALGFGLHLAVAAGLMPELRGVYLMPGRPVLLC